MQNVVAALPQRGLRAEVSNDVHQAISEALYGHPMGNPLQQAQGVHIPPYIVHQLTYRQQLYFYMLEVLHIGNLSR